MAELKLQSEIVRTYRNEYPERGFLFHCPNERVTKMQKLMAKAIGIRNGVSDLLLIDKNILIGCEVKEPGSYHDKEHIQSQVNFGKIIISLGHKWGLVTTITGAMQLLLGEEQGEWLNVDDVQKMIDTCKNKNLRF